MKAEVIQGLPPKLEFVVDANMIGAQQQSYNSLISDVKTGRIKPGLQFLQGIRMVSLHPHAPDSASASDINSYISESSRLKTTFEILDRIHDQDQKVLVFLESIELQEWLAYAIKLRYKLLKLPPRIFGGVPAEERKRIVDRFQESSSSFGVMILSPKAGGVGLTITAASNVIHLSRWWNPAVEDQCTDRAYRIGQTCEVHVYYPRAIHPLYPNDSFDVVLHELLMRKRDLSKSMLIPMEGKQDLDFMVSRVSVS
jgi:SNF2 family DNA or RNA helicase